MSKVTLNINGEDHALDVAPDMPLLWALRDILNFTGTKYSCGIGRCGACNVLLDGKLARACRTQVGQVAGADQSEQVPLTPEPGENPLLHVGAPRSDLCRRDEAGG